MWRVQNAQGMFAGQAAIAEQAARVAQQADDRVAALPASQPNLEETKKAIQDAAQKELEELLTEGKVFVDSLRKKAHEAIEEAETQIAGWFFH